MNPYLLLEISYSASNSEIKKAYRKMALKWHPDKNDGSLEAEEKFKEINAAYECLTDQKKRAAIDAKRWDQEKAEAAKKVREEAARQARSYAQPSQPSRSHFSPLAAMLALIAFVFIIVALFGSSNGGSNSTSA